MEDEHVAEVFDGNRAQLDLRECALARAKDANVTLEHMTTALLTLEKRAQHLEAVQQRELQTQARPMATWHNVTDSLDVF